MIRIIKICFNPVSLKWLVKQRYMYVNHFQTSFVVVVYHHASFDLVSFIIAEKTVEKIIYLTYDFVVCRGWS